MKIEDLVNGQELVCVKEHPHKLWLPGKIYRVIAVQGDHCIYLTAAGNDIEWIYRDEWETYPNKDMFKQLTDFSHKDIFILRMTGQLPE